MSHLEWVRQAREEAGRRIGTIDTFHIFVVQAARKKGINLPCVIGEVGPGHVHVVYEEDASNKNLAQSTILATARECIPVGVRVTADSVQTMGSQALKLLEVNHKLHAENRRLSDTVDGYRALFFVLLLALGAAFWLGWWLAT